MSELACCVHVVDVGTQTQATTRKIRSKREMFLGWELILPDSTHTPKSRVVYKCYELSIAPESSLRKDVERLIGHELNANTYKRFSPKELLGSYCQLGLSNPLNGVDDSSLCVSRVKCLPTDLDRAALPKPKTPYGFFMTSEPDMELLSRLPPEIQAKIRQSIEFTWAIKNQNDHDE